MRPRQSKVSALPNRFLRAQKRKQPVTQRRQLRRADRKSTRLNSSHSQISYAVFCLKKKNIHAEVPVENRRESDRSVRLLAVLNQARDRPGHGTERAVSTVEVRIAVTGQISGIYPSS